MRLFAAVILAVLHVTASAAAVGADKVLYVGGTLKEFPARSGSPVRVTVGAPKVEGTIDITDDRFVFTAGRSGTVQIPYVAISTLHYGADAARPAPKGLVLFMPWDPTEQFTKDVHYLLTIGFRDPSNTDQVVVFELGRDLVRQTLEALERRTGNPVAFQNVDACARYKTREECGYGSTAELKGLKKVGLDAGMRSEDRDSLLAALKTNPADLEVLNSTEGAEIVLKFESVRSPNPQCPCEGGRGEVSVVQGGRQRVVLVFADRKMGVWGKKPAIDFGTAFVVALKDANRIKK